MKALKYFSFMWFCIGSLLLSFIFPIPDEKTTPYMILGMIIFMYFDYQRVKMNDESNIEIQKKEISEIELLKEVQWIQSLDEIKQEAIIRILLVRDFERKGITHVSEKNVEDYISLIKSDERVNFFINS